MLLVSFRQTPSGIDPLLNILLCLWKLHFISSVSPMTQFLECFASQFRKTMSFICVETIEHCKIKFVQQKPNTFSRIQWCTKDDNRYFILPSMKYVSAPLGRILLVVSNRLTAKSMWSHSFGLRQHFLEFIGWSPCFAFNGRYSRYWTMTSGLPHLTATVY